MSQHEPTEAYAYQPGAIGADSSAIYAVGGPGTEGFRDKRYDTRQQAEFVADSINRRGPVLRSLFGKMPLVPLAVVALLTLLLWGVRLRANPPYAVVPTLTVATYGAKYVPSAERAEADDTAERLKRLEEKLDKLQATLDSLLKLAEDDAPPPGVPVPQRQPVTVPPGKAPAGPEAALRSAAGKCATCHHVDVAEQKGNGLALFTTAGTFAKLAERDRKRLVVNVKTGIMPPPKAGQLTEEEKSALLAVFEPPAASPK